MGSTSFLSGLALGLGIGFSVLTSTLFYNRAEPQTSIHETFTKTIIPQPIETCFRKNGPSCVDLVVKEIDSAQETIEFEFYDFTHNSILEALVEANKRGVKITSIGDR